MIQLGIYISLASYSIKVLSALDYVWKKTKALSKEELNETKATKLSPLILQILQNRGITKLEEIEDFILCAKPDESRYNPYLLKDINKATERLVKALKSAENIVIYGDYDADGVTGSSLLYLFCKVYSYFTKKPIAVKVILPERLSQGYGLKTFGVDKAVEFAASLIITIDNGITSNDAVLHANKLGIDVVIIDHHSPNNSIPHAYAIVNPKQQDCQYPDSGLSAVALVYKLTYLLGKALLHKKEREYFQSRYIDLVAIGTYQDLAPLVGENRYFVSEGLKVIKKIHSSKKSSNLRGLSELLSAKGIERGDAVTEQTIGFVIGPLINAAGRIASPIIAFDLLTTNDEKQIIKLKDLLIQVNEKRKSIANKAYLEAIDSIDSNNLASKHKIILLVSTVWHQGIIGLVAQKVVNAYSRSCIVMSKNDDNIYTGSARSYGSFNIGEVLQDFKEHFIYSGGHSKAAGFSMEEAKLEGFKKALFSMADNIDIAEQEELCIDAFIRLSDLDIDLLEQLELLSPFGKANPRPILAAENLVILDIKRSRRGLDTLLLAGDGDGSKFSFVAFGQTKYVEEFTVKDKIDIAFTASRDKNKITAQIIDIQAT